MKYFSGFVVSKRSSEFLAGPSLFITTTGLLTATNQSQADLHGASHQIGDARLDDRANWNLLLTQEEGTRANQRLGPLHGKPFLSLAIASKRSVTDWSGENWKALMPSYTENFRSTHLSSSAPRRPLPFCRSRRAVAGQDAESKWRIVASRISSGHAAGGYLSWRRQRPDAPSGERRRPPAWPSSQDAIGPERGFHLVTLMRSSFTRLSASAASSKSARSKRRNVSCRYR